MPEHVAPRVVDPRIQRAVEFLEAHMGEEVDIKRLGREVGLSASQLSRLFLAQTGASPHGTLSRIRMTAASEMLISGGRPLVKEVAPKVGYRSLSHFTREFERAYGMTPAEFQRACLAAEALR